MKTLNDEFRQLVGDAARAAGCSVCWHHANQCFMMTEGASERKWRPEASGEDSLGLAARQRITISHNEEDAPVLWVEAKSDIGGKSVICNELVAEESKRADAMRLAILRCAAAQAPKVIL